MPAYRIRITGRVQGVFFRSSAKEKAEELNVTGWVRNVSDGSVEVLAEGLEESISRLIQWCHRGPEGARVDNVTIEIIPEEHDQVFTIIKDSRP